jgi:transcriptional regulator with XRE-family HTH domain
MKHAKFIKAIKKAMKGKDISLRALSRQTGIDLSFLSRILSGDRNPPPNSYIVKIAKVLDLNPDQLIVDAGRIPKRAKVLLKGVVEVMKPIFSAFEGKEEEFIDRALNHFFSTEEGQNWFNANYSQSNNQYKDRSFIEPAMEHFTNSDEGRRWFENEFKKLSIPEPDLRPLYESFDKWTTGR